MGKSVVQSDKDILQRSLYEKKIAAIICSAPKFTAWLAIVVEATTPVSGNSR